MAVLLRESAAEHARMEILRAAAACFAERGYGVSSIDDVARRLGATKGRIYHHYPSKADLFADVFRTGMDMNFAAIEPYRTMPGPAVRRWRKLAMVHTLQMIDTRHFQRVVWEGVEMHLRGATTPEQREAFAELIEYRTRYGNIFRQAIAQARAEGDMHFDNLSVANQLMFMTLNSPIFWYSPRVGETRADIEMLAAQVVNFALGGLGGRKDEPS
jgi:AcrR family transcriptional regulator